MDKALGDMDLEKGTFLDTTILMLAGTTFEAKEVVAVFILDVLEAKNLALADVLDVKSSFLKMMDLQSIFTKSILS